MDRTTPPKEDKVGISSAEGPTAHAFVAQPDSEEPDDNLGDDDPDLLNFTVVGSKITCRMSSYLHTYWLDSGKLDCPIWDFGWSSFCSP
jgi:hypothetical protein